MYVIVKVKVIFDQILTKMPPRKKPVEFISSPRVTRSRRQVLETLNNSNNNLFNNRMHFIRVLIFYLFFIIRNK